MKKNHGIVLNNKQGFINIINIIVAILAVLILGGAGYWYATHYQKSGQPVTNLIQVAPLASPTPSTSAETAGWKTYANTKYGFAFQYPPPFGASDRGEANGFIVALKEGLTNTQQLHSIAIFAVSADNTAVFPDYLVKHPINDADSDNPIVFKARTIGSNTFYFARTERFEGVLVFDYYILHDKLVYRFNSVSRGVAWSDPNLDEENDFTHSILKQILTTLKFTNAPTPTTNNTVDWKTCTNSKYKYELKYPSEWQTWKPATGEMISTTCEEGPVILIFSPDIGSYEQVNVDVSDTSRFKDTIYEGVKSIDDYFVKNPLILQARPKIKETLIDGEKLIWLKDSSMLAYHAGSVFQFYVKNVDGVILDNFFSNFKFTK